MLAPRKTLWSTPAAVVAEAESLLSPLTSSDVVYDVGCGDARVLVGLASSFPEVPRLVGVEIDEARSEQAKANVKEAGLEDRISVINENALCLDYEAATAVFLYLVPRGLRIIKPYLTSTRWDLWPYSLVPRSLLKSATVKVVTYMSGLPGVEPKRRVNVEVPHQEGSGWPVYYYELERRGGVDMKKVAILVAGLATAAGALLKGRDRALK
mmetsp:Transcript_24140/g.47995  ORF Transcript_24140/g.47995 Transcript_24140/m.47995 type:complete len:211 (-) Transcript_24140:48-680(-)